MLTVASSLVTRFPQLRSRGWVIEEGGQGAPTWDMKTSSCSWAGGMARRAPSVSRSPGQATRCSAVPSAKRTNVSPTRNSTLAPAGQGPLTGKPACPSAVHPNLPLVMPGSEPAALPHPTQARSNDRGKVVMGVAPALANSA